MKGKSIFFSRRVQIPPKNDIICTTVLEGTLYCSESIWPPPFSTGVFQNEEPALEGQGDKEISLSQFISSLFNGVGQLLPGDFAPNTPKYSTILFCILLYFADYREREMCSCNELYRTALNRTVLYFTVLYCNILYISVPS